MESSLVHLNETTLNLTKNPPKNSDYDQKWLNFHPTY